MGSESSLCTGDPVEELFYWSDVTPIHEAPIKKWQSHYKTLSSLRPTDLRRISAKLMEDQELWSRRVYRHRSRKFSYALGIVPSPQTLNYYRPFNLLQGSLQRAIPFIIARMHNAKIELSDNNLKKLMLLLRSRQSEVLGHIRSRSAPVVNVGFIAESYYVKLFAQEIIREFQDGKEDNSTNDI